MEGLSARLQKLIGNPKLGPDAKLAIGFAGTFLVMTVDAEIIDPRAPAPAPAAAPPPSSAPGPDDTREDSRAIAVQPRNGAAPATGRFH